MTVPLRPSFALTALFALTACTRNAPETDASGPAPSGTTVDRWLTPMSRDEASARLRLGRGVASGTWVELQSTTAADSPTRSDFDRFRGDARFLTLDAMALLHDAFARASPGFDLFVPRLLDRDACARVAVELRVLVTEWSRSGPGAGRARWGSRSELVRALDDSSWSAVRDTFVATLEELVRLFDEAARDRRAIWVLGPS